MPLPLLGSNQDSPDPEKDGATLGDRASVALRAFAGNRRTRARSVDAPDPQHGTHSHYPSHYVAVGGSGSATCLIPALRYRYRTTKSGLLSCRGELQYGVPVTVRCGACYQIFTDVLGEFSPCPFCHRMERGATA